MLWPDPRSKPIHPSNRWPGSGRPGTRPAHIFRPDDRAECLRLFDSGQFQSRIMEPHDAMSRVPSGVKSKSLTQLLRLSSEPSALPVCASQNRMELSSQTPLVSRVELSGENMTAKGCFAAVVLIVNRSLPSFRFRYLGAPTLHADSEGRAIR